MIPRNKKPMFAEEEIMELQWQDGRVVLKSHSPQLGVGDVPAFYSPALGEVEDPARNHGHLFMQEDELARWLHYDEPFNGVEDLWQFQEGGPSNSSCGTSESMVVDPIPSAVAGTSSFAGCGGGSSGTSDTMMLAPEAEQLPRRPRSAEDTKSPGGPATEDAGWDSEDVKLEATNAKKHRSRPPTSLRRSRSAEVHNRSERKRRDKINEKIKALQELIPHSSKSDKASTLDEAIEYLRTLQRQVQMMSLGCPAVPVMFPYANVGIGVTDPTMLMFPNNMVPAAAAAAQCRFPSAAASAAFAPVPSHHIPTLWPPGSNPVDHNLPNPTASQAGMQNPAQQAPLYPSFPYPYQHYTGLYQPQYFQQEDEHQ